VAVAVVVVEGAATILTLLVVVQQVEAALETVRLLLPLA
jgi:hypothetical protein